MTSHTLIRQSCDDYGYSINDVGTRAGTDMSLWQPSAAGWSWMGLRGAVGYPANPGTTWVFQDKTHEFGSGLNEPTIVAPDSFILAWGCTNQRSSQLGIFTLNAPPGYIGLGVVATSNYLVTPQPTSFAGVVCPHASLCKQVQLSVANGDRIWTDQGSHAGGDISLWFLPTTQIAAAVTGSKGHYPDTVQVWDLDPAYFNPQPSS